MPHSQEDTNEMLRKYAYRLWEQAGCPPGREEDFMRLAEKAITKNETPVLNDNLDIAGEDSFPASDPVNHT